METLDKIVEQCNSLISKRDSYSFHFEFPPNIRRFCVIHWSNAKKKWAVSGKTKEYRRQAIHEENALLKFPSDEVMLPYSRPVVEKIIKYLIPLPLYNNSIEARRR